MKLSQHTVLNQQYPKEFDVLSQDEEENYSIITKLNKIKDTLMSVNNVLKIDNVIVDHLSTTLFISISDEKMISGVKFFLKQFQYNSIINKYVKIILVF